MKPVFGDTCNIIIYLCHQVYVYCSFVLPCGTSFYSDAVEWRTLSPVDRVLSQVREKYDLHFFTCTPMNIITIKQSSFLQFDPKSRISSVFIFPGPFYNEACLHRYHEVEGACM